MSNKINEELANKTINQKEEMISHCIKREVSILDWLFVIPALFKCYKIRSRWEGFSQYVLENS